MAIPSAATVSGILTAVFLAVILASALLCALFRRRQKLIPALVLLGVTILSAVIAAFVTRALVMTCGRLIGGLFTPLLGDEVQGWLDSLPTGAEGLTASVGLLTAPIVFLLLFWLVFLVLRITAGIVLRIFYKKADGFCLPGFLTGIGSGIVVGLVLLVPLTCLLTSVSGIAGTFFGTGAADASALRDNVGDDLEDIRADVDKIGDNFMVKTVNTLAGKPVMAMIGAPKIKVGSGSEEKTIRFDLNELLDGFAETAGYALLMADEFDEYNQTHDMTDGFKASVDRTFDSLMQSEWLTQTGAEAVSAVAKSWMNEQAFQSVEYPEVAEFLRPTMKVMLGILSTETGDRLRDDLGTVKQVMYMLGDNHLLMDDMHYEDVMRRLWGGDKLLDSVLDVIGQNEHLKPLVGECRELGFRVLSHVLKKDALEDGTYDEALDQIVPALNDVLDKTPEERETIIRDAVQTAFADYDIDVPDELAVSVAEEMIASAGADGEITRDELLDFLVSHYDVTADIADDYIPDIP